MGQSNSNPTFSRIIWLVEAFLLLADNFANDLAIPYQLLIRTALLVHTSVVFPYGIIEFLNNGFVPISKCRGYLIVIMAFTVWAIPVAVVLLWPEVAHSLILVGIEQTSEHFGRIVSLLLLGIGVAFVIFYRVARSYIIENLDVDGEQSEVIMNYVMLRSTMPAALFSLVVITCISATQLSFLGIPSEMNYEIYARDLSFVLILYLLLYIWYIPERITNWQTRATNYLPSVSVILGLIWPRIGIVLLILTGLGLFLLTRLSPKITLEEMVKTIKSKEREEKRTPIALMYGENPIIRILSMSFLIVGVALPQFFYLIGLFDIITSIIISTVVVAVFFGMERVALSYFQS